ncbi:MAG TPA: DUF4350 domain-containing protein [Candidatus Xenobia bacterium]|nr:DUF4350 domain-containing protein [Candidatus Xenobia bacterium]
MRTRRLLALAAVLALPALAQQMADPNFKASVEHPAYTRDHPRVVLDEAHSNFHTADGRYKPFADLLRRDGYDVVPGKAKFDKAALDGVRVLVIANALAADAGDDKSAPAFAEEECNAVGDWVRNGGSLLLLADHAPFGSAAEILARRFGVDMGKGFVFDLSNNAASPTTLVFSRENGLLADHPITRGRNPAEEIQRVVSFTGQSLSIPDGATAFMQLSSTAAEAASRPALQAAVQSRLRGAPPDPSQPAPTPVGGRAQGLAFTFGEGRVVIMGEAGMFSAQLIRYEAAGQAQEIKMGMNVEGNDNRQLLLNVLHWLSGLLN